MDDQSLAGSEPSELAAPRPKSSKTWLVAFVVLALVSMSAIGFLSYKLYGYRQQEVERKDLLAISASFTKELTTYSATTVEKDVEEVLALSTGNFSKEYTQALGGDEFRKALIETQASSQGKLIDAVIQSLDEEQAEVFVTFDQTVTNKDQKEPKTERRRMELLLIDTSKGWKVDKVTLV